MADYQSFRQKWRKEREASFTDAALDEALDDTLDKARRIVRCRIKKGDRTDAVYHEDEGVVVAEWYVADGKSGVYLMGITGCKIEHMKKLDLLDGAEMRYVLRYTLLLNGSPMAVKEFASNEEGRLGRLLRESTATIGPL